MNPWEPIANHGEFSLSVMTKARAEIENIPMHEEATLIGLIVADGLPNTAVGFVSVASLRGFIEAMAPRDIEVRCGPEEDATVLYAAMMAPVTTVH